RLEAGGRVPQQAAAVRPLIAELRRLEGDRRARERPRPAAAPLERAPVNGAADRPIGVFDSGVGGLTVLRELRRQLPNESTLYLGDEARMPYGPREPAEVVGFTREAMRWFAEADCKLVVIACNTATSVALETVRDEFPVPTIGVIRPGAAAALTATARRAVGVLATVLTVRSGAYVRALRDLDPLVDVAQQACPKLVPLVEDGKADSPAALDAVREYVEPLLTEGGVVRPVVDTLLLGCTHYPLLRAAIEKVADRRVADLSALYKPKKITHAEVMYRDIGLAHAEKPGQAISPQKLGDLRTADAIVHVVRAFSAPSVPHVDGSVDPVRDLSTV